MSNKLKGHASCTTRNSMKAAESKICSGERDMGISIQHPSLCIKIASSLAVSKGYACTLLPVSRCLPATANSYSTLDVFPLILSPDIAYGHCIATLCNLYEAGNLLAQLLV
uniref:Uncharacterized protein n=1 Tax=Micrurus carvalhoi TaxID=3147026 RepID=A0A2H6N8V6_9SAUR